MENLLQYFKSTDDLSLTGFIIRTVVSLIFIYIMTRFLKKRAAGQFTAFDFVFLWMLGALAVAPLLDGKVLFTTTIIATCTLYFWHFFISWIRTKNHILSRIISGKPIVLLEKGKLKSSNMLRAFFNNDLLLSELRLIHAHDLNEIDQVILETNGHLSVVKKSDYTPPTPKDFQITVPPARIPIILIDNGKEIKRNLKSLGLTKKWLMDELNKKGVFTIKQVHLATINTSGEIYYSIKDKGKN